MLSPSDGGDSANGRLVLRALHQLSERTEEFSWEPFLEGIERCWLYQEGMNGPAAALLRFRPGARVPKHAHEGFEHILVLAGSQTDENGTLTAGDLVINSTGTTHGVHSEDGCLVLAIYERRVRFLEPA